MNRDFLELLQTLLMAGSLSIDENRVIWAHIIDRVGSCIDLARLRLVCREFNKYIEEKVKIYTDKICKELNNIGEKTGEILMKYVYMADESIFVRFAVASKLHEYRVNEWIGCMYWQNKVELNDFKLLTRVIHDNIHSRYLIGEKLLKLSKRGMDDNHADNKLEMIDYLFTNMYAGGKKNERYVDSMMKLLYRVYWSAADELMNFIEANYPVSRGIKEYRFWEKKLVAGDIRSIDGDMDSDMLTICCNDGVEKHVNLFE